MESVTSLTLDVAKCTNCRACELACSFAKEGVYAPALTRIRVVAVFSQGINVPIFCVHCADPACMQVCPLDAIQRDDVSGIVRIDKDLCTACSECVEACPIGALQIPEGHEVASMCDLCAGAPACVDHCMYGALRFDSKPDEVFQRFDSPLEGETLEETRWRVATTIADTLRTTMEVER